MGLGLQHRTVDEVATELELASNQVLGLFNRIVRRAVSFLNDITAKAIEASMGGPKQAPRDNPALHSGKGLTDELEEAAKVTRIEILECKTFSYPSILLPLA